MSASAPDESPRSVLQSARTGRLRRVPLRALVPAPAPAAVPAERLALDQLLAALDAELAKMTRPMAQVLVAAIKRAADPSGAIPGRRLAALSDLVWDVLSGAFGATPTAAIDKQGLPLSPYARLVVAGVRAATELAIQPVLADLGRTLSGRPDLLDALTGGRALPPGGTPKLPLVDTARSWIDPNGYTLSDRIWQNGQDVRTAIDTMLQYHVERGTSAVNVAKELEQYLTIEGRNALTKRPYGTKGLANPRRLARTEITRAHGAATIEAARLNPLTAGVGWRLSGSHPKPDECDRNASRDAFGLGPGNYPPRDVPRYPNHPQDKCYLTSVPVRDLNATIEQLGRWVKGEPVPGFEDVGSVPLESKYLLDYLTGFVALGAT